MKRELELLKPFSVGANFTVASHLKATPKFNDCPRIKSF